jgi:hypothetical protein
MNPDQLLQRARKAREVLEQSQGLINKAQELIHDEDEDSYLEEVTSMQEAHFDELSVDNEIDQDTECQSSGNYKYSTEAPPARDGTKYGGIDLDAIGKELDQLDRKIVSITKGLEKSTEAVRRSDKMLQQSLSSSSKISSYKKSASDSSMQAFSDTDTKNSSVTKPHGSTAVFKDTSGARGSNSLDVTEPPKRNSTAKAPAKNTPVVKKRTPDSGIKKKLSKKYSDKEYIYSWKISAADVKAMQNDEIKTIRLIRDDCGKGVNLSLVKLEKYLPDEIKQRGGIAVLTVKVRQSRPSHLLFVPSGCSTKQYTLKANWTYGR